VMLACFKQPRVHRQIVRTVGGSEHVQRTTVIVLFAVAVPAPCCIGVRELAFARTLPISCFTAIAQELPEGSSTGYNRRTVTDDAKGTCIAKQPLVCRGKDEKCLKQGLQCVMLLRTVADLTAAQNARNKLVCDHRVSWFLLLILLAFLSGLTQMAF